MTGNMVGGHQRCMALKAVGPAGVVCVVAHMRNPSDEKMLNNAFNKAIAELEPTALADLPQDLQSAGYDLGATGLDAAETDDEPGYASAGKHSLLQNYRRCPLVSGRFMRPVRKYPLRFTVFRFRRKNV